jgi:hypothetical protein
MNPISYKYRTEIETILSTHASRKQKNLQPEIKSKIKELRVFEDKKEGVFKKIEDLKVKLEEEKELFEQEEARIQGLKNIELKKSKEVDQKLDDILNHYN